MLQRVQKILANTGYCSRRKAEELIEKGIVKVNCKVIKLGDKADPEKDEIKVDNNIVHIENKIYLAFYKPKNCLTTLNDPYKRKTIMDYIKLKQRVFPVGRLDYDAEGLLILTNDGDFANRIMHPRYEKEKTYEAELDRPITNEKIAMLNRGITLVDGLIRPKTRLLGPKKIEIRIHEGRKHLVKRMMKKSGYNVLRLKRTAIGNLQLIGLKPGQYRALSPQEIAFFN